MYHHLEVKYFFYPLGKIFGESSEMRYMCDAVKTGMIIARDIFKIRLTLELVDEEKPGFIIPPIG